MVSGWCPIEEEKEYENEQERLADEQSVEILEFLKKVDKPMVIKVLLVCLIVLSYLLGYVMGYREAFGLVTNYYEEKMDKYCFCQETPAYGNIYDKPLLSDEELDLILDNP